MWTRLLAASAAVSTVALIACHRVPYTQRLQFDVVPDGIMRQLGRSAFLTALSSAPVERKGEDKDVLVRVGRRIAAVANEPDFTWEFALLDDDTVNAWCLPGGYIGFYTGILPVLRNEAGMAFVMGHEVGHAIARHSGERLSQQLAATGGLTALELYLSNASDVPPRSRQLILSALGLGVEVGLLLPFSRTQESEADVLGLMQMAKAGYPPEESIALWDRMDAGTPAGPPAFLSTHPSTERRQQNLREWMPRAKKRFERNRLPEDTLQTLWEAPGRPGA